MSLFFLLLLSLQLSLSSAQNDTVSCPLDFSVLRGLVQGSKGPNRDVKAECQNIRRGLQLVQSEYLRVTGRFLPPLDSAESCWDSYQTLIADFVPNFDIRTTCGFETDWIAEGCMNITTREEFEGNVSRSALNDVAGACNDSLGNSSPCASCTTRLSSLVHHVPDRRLRRVPLGLHGVPVDLRRRNRQPVRPHRCRYRFLPLRLRFFQFFQFKK